MITGEKRHKTVSPAHVQKEMSDYVREIDHEARKHYLIIIV